MRPATIRSGLHSSSTAPCSSTARPLAASIRTVNHVKQAALIGADVVTAPPATLKALVNHPLTDKGLAAFLGDWAKTGQKIG